MSIQTIKGKIMPNLSHQAQSILNKVLNEMQQAEEIEGVKDENDYLNLMESIRFEAQKRFNNCVDNMEA